VRPWILVYLSFKASAVSLFWAHFPVIGVLVWFAPDPWLVAQFLLPRQQAFGPALTRFDTRAQEVWLTIDDGPDPASTPATLALLQRHGARATFFVVGEQVARHPELARAIVAAGHTLANHSHTHPAASFWRAAPTRIAAEVDGCVAALLLANVPFERYFRPPVGIRNPFLEPALAARGIELVLWNARGFDGGPRPAAAALRAIAGQIRPGAILLAHEAGPRAAGRLEFLTLLLEHLQAAGYACVLPPRPLLRTR
jgi:peptidoglycan/xylan/chitin deacetylase (PgdA/CDA1 family)